MAAKKLEPRLHFELLIGVDIEAPCHRPCVGLKITHIPASVYTAVRVQESNFLLTRPYAEKLRDLINEALAKPEAETLN